MCLLSQVLRHGSNNIQQSDSQQPINLLGSSNFRIPDDILQAGQIEVLRLQE
jgi:hypothetical protein